MREGGMTLAFREASVSLASRYAGMPARPEPKPVLTIVRRGPIAPWSYSR